MSTTKPSRDLGIAPAEALRYDMNGPMKMSLIASFVAGMVATVAAQGSLNSGPSLAYVNFQNSGLSFFTADDRLVYFGEVGGEKLVGTNYAASLYYARPGASELRLIPDSIRLFRVPTTTGLAHGTQRRTRPYCSRMSTPSKSSR